MLTTLSPYKTIGRPINKQVDQVFQHGPNFPTWTKFSNMDQILQDEFGPRTIFAAKNGPRTKFFVTWSPLPFIGDTFPDKNYRMMILNSQVIKYVGGKH